MIEYEWLCGKGTPIRTGSVNVFGVAGGVDKGSVIEHNMAQYMLYTLDLHGIQKM